MPSASYRPATVVAPVRATTSASASQWSWWRCVVMTRARPASLTRRSSVSASLAASISTCSSVCRQRSRYALLSIGPTATLVIISLASSCVCTGPPTWTLPWYSVMCSPMSVLSAPRRYAGKLTVRRERSPVVAAEHPAQQSRSVATDDPCTSRPLGRRPLAVGATQYDQYVVRPARRHVGQQHLAQLSRHVVEGVPEPQVDVMNLHLVQTRHDDLVRSTDDSARPGDFCEPRHLGQILEPLPQPRLRGHEIIDLLRERPRFPLRDVGFPRLQRHVHRLSDAGLGPVAQVHER